MEKKKRQLVETMLARMNTSKRLPGRSASTVCLMVGVTDEKAKERLTKIYEEAYTQNFNDYVECFRDVPNETLEEINKLVMNPDCWRLIQLLEKIEEPGFNAGHMLGTRCQFKVVAALSEI